MDVTPAYPGPLTADVKLVKNTEKSIDKSLTGKNVSRDTANGTFTPSSPYDTEKMPNNGLFHYPMDPGHPTVPYNGPYSPDYKPTQPSLDQVFRLPANPEKSISAAKEKSKSKIDAKKPVESIKVHKEADQQYGHRDDDQHRQHQPPSQRFPGPLAPDRFPVDKPSSTSTRTKTMDNPSMTSLPINPNKLPPLEKTGHTAEQPQFIPLKPQPEVPGGPFGFVPTNGENIPPTRFANDYANSDAGPPYGGPALHARPDFHEPNFVVAPIPKKKTSAADAYVDDFKIKPAQPGVQKAKPGQRIPYDQGILPEELYHLISQQHPGLTHLEHAVPQGHSGLFDIHRQIATQKDPPGYFSHLAALPGNGNNANENGKPPQRPPHIVAQKNENGQTTYHVHTSEVPNSPQQIEELLAHISQHDSNLGPFQRYPGQAANDHNYPDAADSPPPPPVPPGIDIRLPGSSGSPHLNHPFAAQASPNQSGSFAPVILVINSNFYQSRHQRTDELSREKPPKALDRPQATSS